MKKLFTVTAAVALLALPGMALAGIAGGDHDFSGGAVGGGQAALCQSCHLPHNAAGTKIWWVTPTGTFTGVQDLCFSCHNGTISTVGATTVMNTSKAQHTSPGTSDCSGTGACHNVHDQNPDLGGKFLVLNLGGNTSYCIGCHDADGPPAPMPAGPGGDHTTGNQHFTNGAAFDCDQCHSVHGAVPQGQGSEYFLLGDNFPVGDSYKGAFCQSCHAGTVPPAALPGTGGTASSDIFASYKQTVNNGTETTHPTDVADVGGCFGCHEVHNEAQGPFPFILQETNNSSAYCKSCHEAGTAPAVGGSTHPVQQVASGNVDNTGATPPLCPWSDEINDDGVGGIDYATAASGEVVCESCHSAHRKGVTGNFLRVVNTAANEICVECHDTQGAP
jgi:predicted CXXCH cytochrome family protein